MRLGRVVAGSGIVATQVHTQISIFDVMRDLTADILEWSRERPGWQRDALRRIFKSKELASSDFAQLAGLCKSARGLCNPHASEPLSAEHLSPQGGSGNAVTLVSITHHRGVNALAAEQTVVFGPNLTVVYGPNAAGKSGYTRILKRACRSRGIEQVLGNVLSGEAPLKPEATIRFREGNAESSFVWGVSTPSSAALSRVSVFDSHCAPVYLKDKTDVVFRPFGLDVFDKLSDACDEVRAILEAEQTKLDKTSASLPVLRNDTRAKALLDNLTSLTKHETVIELAELSSTEERRLGELRDKQQDFLSSNPKQRARELRLKSERFKQVLQHLETLSEVFDDKTIVALRSAADSVEASKRALAMVQRAALTSDLIPHTGDQVWKEMWEAAVEFAESAFPGQSFPSSFTRCPLCQQVIGPDAASRLMHFSEYVASQVQVEVGNSERIYEKELSAFEEVSKLPDVTLLLKEILDEDPELADRIEIFLSDASAMWLKIREAARADSLPNRGLKASPAGALSATVNSLAERADKLEKEQAAIDPGDTAELSELEDRVTLRGSLQEVLDEIERKQRLAAYSQCLDDTSTHGITRKSSELTKEVVTEHLQSSFQ